MPGSASSSSSGDCRHENPTDAASIDKIEPVTNASRNGANVRDFRLVCRCVSVDERIIDKPPLLREKPKFVAQILSRFERKKPDCREFPRDAPAPFSASIVQNVPAPAMSSPPLWSTMTEFARFAPLRIQHERPGRWKNNVDKPSGTVKLWTEATIGFVVDKATASSKPRGTQRTSWRIRVARPT